MQNVRCRCLGLKTTHLFGRSACRRTPTWRPAPLQSCSTRGGCPGEPCDKQVAINMWQKCSAKATAKRTAQTHPELGRGSTRVHDGLRRPFHLPRVFSQMQCVVLDGSRHPLFFQARSGGRGAKRGFFPWIDRRLRSENCGAPYLWFCGPWSVERSIGSPIFIFFTSSTCNVPARHNNPQENAGLDTTLNCQTLK